MPSSLGRIMAERTTQSWTTVPHFFVSRDIEAERAERIPRTHGSRRSNARIDVRITHTDLLVALAARVLLKHPRLNASWSAEGIRLHDHVNMGIAIAVNDGVVAAVIPNAHTREPGGNCACSGATWPSARGQGSCARRISPTPPSPSATSACIKSINSARSSRRRKRRFSPWEHCRSRGRRARPARSAAHDDADSLLRSSRGRWRPRSAISQRPSRSDARTREASANNGISRSSRPI